jgi:dUTP pyrophosphatase
MAQMSDIVIQIERLPGAEDIALPEYQSDGAAGMDVVAAVESSVRVEPGKIALIPTGFAIALMPGLEAQLRPRSGLATKHGITLINSPGTIDSDYRGEIMVAVINLGTEVFEISRGMRIAQIVIAPVERVRWQQISPLPSTSRGTSGLGHTGK